MRTNRFALIIFFHFTLLPIISQNVRIESYMGITTAMTDVSIHNDIGLTLLYSPVVVPNTEFSMLSLYIEDPELETVSYQDVKYMRIIFGDGKDILYFDGDIKDKNPLLSSRNDTKQYVWHDTKTIQLNFFYWLGGFYIGDKYFNLSTHNISVLNKKVKSLFFSYQNAKVEVKFKQNNSNQPDYILSLEPSTIFAIRELYAAFNKK